MCNSVVTVCNSRGLGKKKKKQEIMLRYSQILSCTDFYYIQRPSLLKLHKTPFCWSCINCYTTAALSMQAGLPTTTHCGPTAAPPGAVCSCSFSSSSFYLTARDPKGSGREEYSSPSGCPSLISVRCCDFYLPKFTFPLYPSQSRI